MVFADCVSLIRQCIEKGILQPHENDTVLIYREAGTSPEFPEGWYAEPVDGLAQDLMTDTEGQKALISALAEKGITFQKEYEEKILPLLDKIFGGK